MGTLTSARFDFKWRRRCVDFGGIFGIDEIDDVAGASFDGHISDCVLLLVHFDELGNLGTKKGKTKGT